MSTVVAEQVPAFPTDATAVARRSTVGTLAIAGLVAAVGGGLLLATSGHLVDPVGYGAQVAAMVVGTVVAALYWLVRRPGNPLGVALLALAIATATISLQGATQPLLHSIGVAADSAVFLLVYYVVFAFPDGRVGRLEQVILGAWVLYFFTAIGPWLFFTPVISGGAPLAGCNAACPGNALLIADRPTIAAPFGSDMSYGTIAVSSATLACLLYRLATATRPRRRALLPVYVPAVMLTVPALIFHGAVVRHLHLDASIVSTVGWFLTFGWIALPYGFLLAIVLTTFFAAAALKTIVGRLVDRPSAAQLRTTLADALDDASLELAFPVDRVGGFVDSSGSPVNPTTAGGGRSATRVERNGETVAVIVHDEALETDPELVATAGQALLLAIENGRLITELESTFAELRASRARVVAAGDAERRRIERDLHDGAQQHLVALRIRVGLAGELAASDPEAARRLGELGTELEEILQELRDLAQGLYPPVLRQFGLREALASVTRRSAQPATLETTATRRYPEDIEAAVYFCCLEGLQNVGKHAGVDASAVIRLWERGDQLRFEISDDGVGYDVERVGSSGHGLANMSDRMAAFGGTVSVDSAIGRGTTVRGTLPIAERSR